MDTNNAHQTGYQPYKQQQVMQISCKINMYLRNDGYVCDIACTAPEAIEKILIYTYDCIPIDVSLPENNGFVVFDTLRQCNKTGSVILMDGTNRPAGRIPVGGPQ